MTTGLSPQTARFSAALGGRYRIERELGAGGMATVYLAEDPRHHRRVAIKVLHPELSAVLGTERFLREIELTANLQHPHILPLFDSGEADGLLFYVMPYVDGETLRARLERERQLPIPDAVRIARETAEALDYAQRHGVIHRDIKPENILLHEGRVLVADFGIALAVRNAGGARITGTGLSLGTPQYMSPEQATAERDVDARSDVYSLGSVLYELLAGQPPHTGPTTQSVVLKVISEKPQPVSELRDSVSPALATVVHTALAKLPADRYATAGELAAALAGVPAPGAAPAAPVTAAIAPSARRPRAREAALLGAVVLVALPIGWALGWRTGRATSPSVPPTRLSIFSPGLGGSGATGLQHQLAFTPDGQSLLYVVLAADGISHLVRQSLDAPAPSAIPGLHDNIANPVVSPDGRWLVGTVFGFREIYRYPIDGGEGQAIPLQVGAGAQMTIAPDGAIWLSSGGGGVSRVKPGEPSTQPWGERGSGLKIGQVMPDERTLLAVRSQLGTSGGPVVLVDLRTGALRQVSPQTVVEARYTSGYLVWAMLDGTLQAQPFDPGAGRLSGTAVTIATGVTVTGNGVAQFAVAPNGNVAYIPEEPRALVFYDRAGTSRLALEDRHNFHAPKFSPDGRRLAVDFTSFDGRDVWIISLDQETTTRATFDHDGHDPVWTPDGRQITYSSTKSGPLGIYRKRPGSTEPAESLLASPKIGYTGTWLPDGSALLTTGIDLLPHSTYDVALVTNGGHGPIQPLVASPFTESYPALSPDGRWVAYVSDESGQQQVYVRALRGEGDPVVVSTAGGTEPVWSPRGDEVFYRSLGGGEPQLVAARVRTAPQLAVVERRALFSMNDIVGASPHASFDVSPDGKTFVMVRRNPATRITVIQNLPALVRRLQASSAR